MSRVQKGTGETALVLPDVHFPVFGENSSHYKWDLQLLENF